MLQYVEDYDEMLPPGLWGNGTAGWQWVGYGQSGMGMGWAGQIYAYLKSTGVYNCPDDSTKPVPQNNGAASFPISYAFNSMLPREPLAIMGAPSTTVMLYEVANDYTTVNDPLEGTEDGGISKSPNGNPYILSAIGDGYPYVPIYGDNDIQSSAATCAPTGGNCFAGWGNVGPATPAVGGTAARHDPTSNQLQGGSNYLLADGHVKYLQAQNVWSGFNMGPNGDLGNGAPSDWPFSGAPFVVTFNPIESCQGKPRGQLCF